VPFLEAELILKIAGIGIISAVAYTVLQRSGREDQASLVSLAGVVVSLLLIVSEMGKLFSAVKTMFGF